MARELADVLHYLLPDRDPGRDSDRGIGARPRAAVPTLAIAADPDDPLRAAFAWNLSVDITRLGSRASLLTPPDGPFDGSAPGAGAGPVGAEIVLADAADLGSLDDTARELARGRGGSGGGFLLVRVPARWAGESPGASLLGWTLLFCSPSGEEQRRAAELATCLQGSGAGQRAGGARVGLTVHGVEGVDHAEQVFLAVAERVERATGRPLLSYGALLDDLQVYRTFVDGRPVGLRHPQSRAAAAVADVARLLLSDAGDGS